MAWAGRAGLACLSRPRRPGCGAGAGRAAAAPIFRQQPLPAVSSRGRLLTAARDARTRRADARPVGAGVACGEPWRRPAGSSVRVRRMLPLQPGSAPGPVPRREGGGRVRGSRRAAAARRRKTSPSSEIRKRARSFRASRRSAVPHHLSKYAWPLLPFPPPAPCCFW